MIKLLLIAGVAVCLGGAIGAAAMLYYIGRNMFRNF